MIKQELTDIKTARHNALVNWDAAIFENDLSKIANLNGAIEGLDLAIELIDKLERQAEELEQQLAAGRKRTEVILRHARNLIDFELLAELEYRIKQSEVSDG